MSSKTPKTVITISLHPQTARSHHGASFRGNRRFGRGSSCLRGYAASRIGTSAYDCHDINTGQQTLRYIGSACIAIAGLEGLEQTIAWPRQRHRLSPALAEAIAVNGRKLLRLSRSGISRDQPYSFPAQGRRVTALLENCTVDLSQMELAGFRYQLVSGGR